MEFIMLYFFRAPGLVWAMTVNAVGAAGLFVGMERDDENDTSQLPSPVRG